MATHRLVRDRQVDVAVVGGGISGALMSYCLTEAGLSVAVLDRRDPLMGSTMASTALLQFEIDRPLFALCEEIGGARARRVWHASLRSVRDLAQLIVRERIRCGFALRRSLYLAGNAYGQRALAAEVRSRARASIPGAWLDRRTLHARFGIDRTGAIESEHAAVANPAQLTAGILRRAIAGGARIYSPAAVVDASSTGRDVRLYLGDGHVVHARAAVFCTGYERPLALPRTDQSLKSTWAVATHPLVHLPAWLMRTVVWEASDPYLYLRSTPDGRLVAGGEDEDSADRHMDTRILARKSQAIVRKLTGLLPELSFTLSHVWAGAFGESRTGLPVIDEIPGLCGCFSVTGFGGNGITYSMMAARLVTAALQGHRAPDLALFRSP